MIVVFHVTPSPRMVKQCTFRPGRFKSRFTIWLYVWLHIHITYYMSCCNDNTAPLNVSLNIKLCSNNSLLLKCQSVQWCLRNFVTWWDEGKEAFSSGRMIALQCIWVQYILEEERPRQVESMWECVRRWVTAGQKVVQCSTISLSGQPTVLFSSLSKCSHFQGDRES